MFFVPVDDVDLLVYCKSQMDARIEEPGTKGLTQRNGHRVWMCWTSLVIQRWGHESFPFVLIKSRNDHIPHLNHEHSWLLVIFVQAFCDTVPYGRLRNPKHCYSSAYCILDGTQVTKNYSTDGLPLHWFVTNELEYHLVNCTYVDALLWLNNDDRNNDSNLYSNGDGHNNIEDNAEIVKGHCCL